MEPTGVQRFALHSRAPTRQSSQAAQPFSAFPAAQDPNQTCPAVHDLLGGSTVTNGTPTIK